MSLVQLSPYPTLRQIGEPYSISVNNDVLKLLSEGAAVAIGVSGGKDSSAVALRTVAFLKEIRHRGPVVLIHSDLGRIEWRDSLPMCQRLADRLGIELITVRRKSGDMLARWQQRWRDNTDRYASMLCVRLILPWSTPQMRFCTSELKQQVICQELVKRFPGKVILSVSGIRREESRSRAAAPVLRKQPRLCRETAQTAGFDWNPILDWSVEQVFSFLERERTHLHEAYTVYNSSRVSCCFCILASRRDLLASSKCAEHREIYCELVNLELLSTFSFQEGQWLADIAPHLLPKEVKQKVVFAKAAAAARIAAEEEIPSRLLFTKGWPSCIPNQQEARTLADVRIRVATSVGIPIDYIEPAAIIARYEELMLRKK